MRHIVVADLHGRKNLLTNALEHCNFDGDNDILVILGDTCDIGRETMTLHEMLFELNAIQLIGNHEIAHMCSLQIHPYDFSLDPEYKSFIALGIDLEQFKLAYSVDDILLSHAGVSYRLAVRGVNANGSEDSFLSSFHNSSCLTAEVAATELNNKLKNLVHIDTELGLIDFDGSPLWLDRFHPLWFRPYDISLSEEHGLYNGFRQIVGHTPITSFSKKKQDLLEKSNSYFIDPYCPGPKFVQKGYCKYAIIEDGEISIVVG